jgi:hypothetical protein
MKGQGAVLFPELLSLRRKLERQSFGVVFLDRLTRSQVDSVAARQLLVLLQDTGYAETNSAGTRLRLERTRQRLREELCIVGDIEMACADGDPEPAQRYLSRHGWRLEKSGYYVDLDNGFSQVLRTAAQCIGDGLLSA